ncbi:methyltransferase, putative [Plasmodium malariae]|uniref:Methyltransferase, putative n=1 Tax=Plasmodium malariae TaxID=5858 RepID=A0A1C3KE36_PLAMA|nr:methyltransferase, putative [Plasmodium malariae]
MNYVKLSLHSYPVKCYGKTYKVSNTLKLKGIGLKSLDEEEIRNIFKKLDIRCMAYLVDKEDIIYLEFYKKKECSQIFSFFNKNAVLMNNRTVKAEYVNIRYNVKEDAPSVYVKDYTVLTRCSSDGISIYNDAIDQKHSDEIIRNYENESWLKYTNNNEINVGHYFCRSTPNKIYKSYCIKEFTAFFSPEFLKHIISLLNNRQPNQVSILKCHTKKSIEYVIESSYIFEDEIAFLVLDNELPMSFLDIMNERKINLLMPKNALLRIKGKLRYEFLFGVPKKKTINLEDTVVDRKDSFLLIFRYINENNLKNMLIQNSYKKKIIKDEKQEKTCIPINVNDYTSDSLEKTYVLDVYNQIAQHFCYTRYKSWNNVENIINEEKEGNVILDVGCGNGKNVKGSCKYFFIGLDFSYYLLKLAQRKCNTDLFLANCVNIPLKSNVADLCISVAVIHHIGTHEKRKRAVSEMVRCTKIGGRVLIYVWAYEQQENVVGNRKFDSQDIFVPWYLQPNHKIEASEEQIHQCLPVKKDLLKLQRYYHVFKKEELYELCQSIRGVFIEDFFFDCNNWAVLLRKVC